MFPITPIQHLRNRPETFQPCFNVFDDFICQNIRIGEVVEIGERKQPEISEAANEEQAEEIWVEMQEEMVTAVEAKGMTVEEYNEITQQAQMDPDLAAQINEIVRSE